MRRLIAMLLLTVASRGQAQTEPCIPDLNPTALERVSVTSQHCGLRLQSYLRASGAELTGSVTIGIDARDAIRIVQKHRGATVRAAANRRRHRCGRNGDSIYWGIWSTEGTLGVTEDRVDESPRSLSAMPYVAGVPSKALPQADGLVRYGLIGAPFVISGSNNMYAPVANADGRSVRIDPAPISGADLLVDFNARTAKLNLRFIVRGVPVETAIELRQRKSPSLTFDEVDCEGATNCSTATLNFYGKDAMHAGILLTVFYDRVMPQADWVAAHLANVSGKAAIALSRRDTFSFPASPVIRQR
jgi:hypothetical protein